MVESKSLNQRKFHKECFGVTYDLIRLSEAKSACSFALRWALRLSGSSVYPKGV